MFGISGEHLLVLLVVLLIFGPRRLPDLGHSIGRTLKNFKDAMAGNETSPTVAPPAASTAPAAPKSQLETKPAEVNEAHPASMAAVSAASSHPSQNAQADKI